MMAYVEQVEQFKDFHRRRMKNRRDAISQSESKRNNQEIELGVSFFCEATSQHGGQF